MTGTTYLIAGCAVLLAVVLPQVLDRWAVSAPMVLVTVGLALGATPLTDELIAAPGVTLPVVLHLTELTVIVALMGVGLALNRPLTLRDRASWTAWSTTSRLLLIGMPLSIAVVALLGVSVGGLSLSAAILLGAVLAPTDPVLASDIQVQHPVTHATAEEGEHPAEHDDEEVSFALTAEAGLNDGLAFPFVHLALAVAAGIGGAAHLAGTVAWLVVGKVLIGWVAGVTVGWLLARLVFGGAASLRLAQRNQPLVALTGVLLAYGAAEVAHGYGFIAVFVCAVTLRSSERHHEFQSAMHNVIERLEVLLTLAILLMLGVAASRGLLASLDWRGALIGVAVLLVVRPATALASLTSRRQRELLSPVERGAVAFLGVRGVGSLYYLAYASHEHHWARQDWLWATVAFTILVSVLVHGVTATPLMRRVQAATGHE